MCTTGGDFDCRGELRVGVVVVSVLTLFKLRWMFYSLQVYRFPKTGLSSVNWWQDAGSFLHRKMQFYLKYNVHKVGLKMRWPIVTKAVSDWWFVTLDGDIIKNALVVNVSYFARFSSNIVSILLRGHAWGLYVFQDQSIVLGDFLTCGKLFEGIFDHFRIWL